MPDEKNFLADEMVRAVELLADTFAARSIRYALVGGLAAMLRGRPRFTQHIDILLEVTQLALPGLLEELARLGFKLDMATVIESVKRTSRLVMVEESFPVCSIGSEICARVAMEAFDYLDAPPAKVSGEDVPMPYAANLEKLALPNTARVVQAVRKVCNH